MKRRIDYNLDRWFKNPDKKPLIIKGARQVGKTYSIRQFAKRNYKNLIEINFERELEYAELFDETRDPKEILNFLKLSFIDVSFDKNTLLFLDEIQASPNALTTLKFLSEDFPMDIVCSGSVLGVAISSTSSFPVGYVEIWDMFPLTFKEYLWALGLEESIFEMLNESILTHKPIESSMHKKLNDIFVDYLIVGGMPEVVSTFLENKSYRESLNVQRRIVQDYTHDFAKYASGSDRIKTRECFESIPLQLAKNNKKFQYSVVKKGTNARYYDSSLRWLKDSGLIIQSNRLSAIKFPLEAFVELPVFKVFMGDTGLLISQYNEKIIQDIMTGDLGIYKGALFENIVAQLLHSNNKRMVYYEPNQHSEIDFIINYEGDMTPIEVKASTNTQSKSFTNFINKHKPAQAVRVSMKNVGFDEPQKTLFMPFYLFEFWLDLEQDILLDL